MADTNQSPFLELSDFWLSITRRDFNARGVGKWMLYAPDPLQTYQRLRDILIKGGLPEVISIKTRREPRGAVEGIFVYTAPYTDLEKVSRVAEELLGFAREQGLELVRPLLFKTDLHNTWGKVYSRPGDGYHELLEKKYWIYQYQDGKLVVNAVVQALHRAMEDPPENTDPEFLIIRSMMTAELFAGTAS